MLLPHIRSSARDDDVVVIKQFLQRVWAGGTADSELYEMVASEIASERMDVGLWTKACAATEGDLQKAKARYIELRVSDLRLARRALERQSQQEQRLLQSEAARQGKLAQINSQVASVQQQMWELHDSPEAKRRRKSLHRISTIVVTLLAIPGLGWSWIKAHEVLGVFLFFGGGVLVLLFLIWLLANSPPKPSRGDLLKQLQRLERQLERT